MYVGVVKAELGQIEDDVRRPEPRGSARGFLNPMVEVFTRGIATVAFIKCSSPVSATLQEFTMVSRYTNGSYYDKI